MLPGDVWEVNARDLVKALDPGRGEHDEPHCRVGLVTLQLWESNYLTGLKLGDVMDVISGDGVRIALEPDR